MVVNMVSGQQQTWEDFALYEFYSNQEMPEVRYDLICLPQATGPCAMGYYNYEGKDYLIFVSTVANMFNYGPGANTYMPIYLNDDPRGISNVIDNVTTYTYDNTTYYVYEWDKMPLSIYDDWTLISKSITAPENTNRESTINMLCGQLGGSTAPYIDINVYTQGSNKNTLYTFVWSNLQNIPANYTEEDFKIWFGVSDVSGQQGILARLVDYTDPNAQFNWDDLFNSLASTQYPVAEAQGYFFVSANLLYVDSNGNNVVCETYCFRIFDTGLIVDEETNEYGTVNIYLDTSPKEDDSFNDGTGNMDGQAEGQALSVDNLLTTSYVLTEAQLISFGHYIWANDLQTSLMGNQVAPIENILSCKRIPFEVDGTQSHIWIGNVDTLEEGLKSTATHVQVIGTVGADELVSCHNWMDFEPATVISIYLPYIGIQKLQTNLIMYCSNSNSIPVVHSRPITVKYYYDIIYGSCVACVYVTNEDNDLILIGSFNGECGIDIPITASNRASNQLALIKQGANTTASTIGALTSGNVFGAFGGFIQGNLEQQIEKRTAEVHFQTSGGISSQVASYLPGSVTIFIEHPNYTEPSTYGEEVGYPCNLTRNIGSLTGYTVISHNVNLKDIPCLDEEKEMLLEALTGGFYL